MKKFIALILTILYFSSSTGATIHMHYCMGKLADWGLGHASSKTCGSCGMEKSNANDNGCCKDEQKFLKNTADQKMAESSFLLMNLPGAAFIYQYPDLPILQLVSITEASPMSHAPPQTDATSLYIRNCTFRI